MQFHFQLLPVDEIPPWGGAKPQLHHFGLTAGWFWISVGDHELFRYTEEAQNYWASQDTGYQRSALPYEDYAVARYWDDLLQMLPEVLDPVPGDLAARAADTRVWEAWQTAERKKMEESDTDDAWDTFYAAVGWWGRRTWDAFHLTHPPQIWLWRVGDTVHIRWDNRAITLGDGIPVWTATVGETILPVTDFIAAVTDFNDRFLSAMQERVDSINTHWSRPEVAIDLEELTKSQEAQTQLLPAALNPWTREVRRGLSWEGVRAAIDTLSARH